MTQSSWYAVHTKPQQEAIAHRDLQRLGIPLFYPLQRIRRHIRRNGALIPQWTTRPHFPRWLFVYMAMKSLWRVRKVRAVSSVACGASAEPVAIPDVIMSILMSGGDADGIMASGDEVARRRFETASAVMFMEGTPLEGVIATVISDDGRQLVEVVLRMLGGERRVSVPANTLQSVA
jgi:transcriptional antiterminator RfaH